MKQFNAIISSLLLLGSVIVCADRTEAGGATGQIITFDVPGSACQPAFSNCTQAFAINASGAVVGWYADSTRALHGFLREADGSFIGIDPPGATFNRPTGINDGGTIVGSFFSNSTGGHNYIRIPNGSFTTFDVPGAASFAADSHINQAGTVAGDFSDVNGNNHGFIRSQDGKILVFDVPGAINGIQVWGINAEDAVVGFYFDENSAHGFVRSSDRTILSFDYPGSLQTLAYGINPAGEIVGYYTDQNFITHGFVRNTNGSFISFDAANPPFVTNPVGITPGRVIAGSCQRLYQPCGGFVRAQNGSTTLFNPPNSIDTVVTGISDAGLIVGWYDDIGFLQHAFIRTPRPPQAAAAGN